MSTFQIVDGQSIDTLLDTFTNKFGPIPSDSQPKYVGFVRTLTNTTFVNESEAVDLMLLFGYITGDRLIVDRNTGKKRRIEKLDNLMLLSYTNVRAKDKQENRLNPELFRLFNRIRIRYQNYDTPNGQQTLDKIFQNPETIQCLDGLASYNEHVRLHKLQIPPIKIDQPMEKYIPPELIPLWLSYKNDQNQLAKKTLIEHYTQTFCIKICRSILSKFPQIRNHYSSPEELISLTYEELEKRMGSFDLSLGYRFEGYSYRAIYGRIIDQLRQEKILERKHQKYRLRTVSIEEPVYGTKRIVDALGITPEELVAMDSSLMEGMKPRARIVFEAVLEGKRYKEIREEIGGVSLPRCSQLYTEALNYLRKKLAV